MWHEIGLQQRKSEVSGRNGVRQGEVESSQERDQERKIKTVIGISLVDVSFQFRVLFEDRNYFS